MSQLPERFGLCADRADCGIIRGAYARAKYTRTPADVCAIVRGCSNRKAEIIEISSVRFATITRPLGGGYFAATPGKPSGVEFVIFRFSRDGLPFLLSLSLSLSPRLFSGTVYSLTKPRGTSARALLVRATDTCRIEGLKGG